MKNMELLAARKQSGKTQAQVARETGISLAQYQNLEYGKSTPNIRTAIRIADALGVGDLRELFAPAPGEIHGTMASISQKKGI